MGVVLGEVGRGGGTQRYADAGDWVCEENCGIGWTGWLAYLGDRIAEEVRSGRALFNALACGIEGK